MVRIHGTNGRGSTKADLARFVDGPLTLSKRLVKHRRQLDSPTMHGRVIDRQAPFSHHLFEVVQAQRVGHVPALASQHHVQQIMESFQDLAQGGVRDLHRQGHRSSFGRSP